MITTDSNVSSYFKEAFQRRHLSDAALVWLQNEDCETFTVKFHGMFLPYMRQTTMDFLVAAKNIDRCSEFVCPDLDVLIAGLEKLLLNLIQTNTTFVTTATFSALQAAAVLLVGFEASVIYQRFLDATVANDDYDRYNRLSTGASEFIFIWKQLSPHFPQLAAEVTPPNGDAKTAG